MNSTGNIEQPVTQSVDIASYVIFHRHTTIFIHIDRFTRHSLDGSSRTVKICAVRHGVHKIHVDSVYTIYLETIGGGSCARLLPSMPPYPVSFRIPSV